MAFDPYSEMLGIPPGPRPPSPEQLLGIQLGATSEQEIMAAAWRQNDRLQTYVLGQWAEVAGRLQREVASAVVELTRRASDAPHPPIPSAVASSLTSATDDATKSVVPPSGHVKGIPSRANRPEVLAPTPYRPLTDRFEELAAMLPELSANENPVAVPPIRRQARRPSAPWYRIPLRIARVVLAILLSPVTWWTASTGTKRTRKHRSSGISLNHVFALGVLLATIAATVYLGGKMAVSAARWRAHYQMQQIVADLQATVDKTYGGGRRAVGVEGNIPIAASQFAAHLPYAPSYIADLGSRDDGGARRYQQLVAQMICKLPPGADLTPLREIPPSSFAYSAAQEVLNREAGNSNLDTR